MENSPAGKRAKLNPMVRKPLKPRALENRIEVTSSDNVKSLDKIGRKPFHYNSVNEELILDDFKENRNSPIKSGDVKKLDKDVCEQLLRDDGDCQDYFSVISDEIIISILRFFPQNQLLTTIALVCKRWHRLSRDKSLWKKLDLSRQGSRRRYLKEESLVHIFSLPVVDLTMDSVYVKYTNVAKDTTCSDGTRNISFNNSLTFAENFKTRLTHLDLEDSNVLPQTLIELFNRCDMLTTVNLSSLMLNSDVFKALANSKDLDLLNLYTAFGVDLAGLKNLLEGCKKLRNLNVERVRLDKSCIRYLCSNLPPSLQLLNLGKSIVTNNNIKELVSRCPHLSYLDLTQCDELTPKVIYQLVKLEELDYLVLTTYFKSDCYSILKKLKRKFKQKLYVDAYPPCRC